jgi:hypothetical protein
MAAPAKNPRKRAQHLPFINGNRRFASWRGYTVVCRAQRQPFGKHFPVISLEKKPN